MRPRPVISLVIAALTLALAAPASAQAAGWSVQPTPQTVDTGAAVFCATSSSCMAAGTFRGIGGGAVKPQLLSWNGLSWSSFPAINPGGARAAALTGIACAPSTTCVTVGWYTNSSGVQVTLAEGYVSRVWSVMTTPNPAGARSSELHAIACTSATSCLAVGAYVDSGGVQRTLAEHWDGTTWTVRTTPNPAGTVPVLDGIACSASTACTAVGSYVDGGGVRRALAQRWNGSSWAPQTAANPAGSLGADLHGVSCWSVTDCMAVGSSVDATGVVGALTERWNGSIWSIQATAVPPTARSAQLSGVSCVSTVSCISVGSWFDGTTDRPLATSYAGSPLAALATVMPSGATSAAFRGISCATASACVAIGDSTVFGTGKTMAERWNGSLWNTLPTGGATDGASHVSCTSSTACTAVGSYSDPTGSGLPFAERWNGAGWAAQSPPSPAGATATTLHDVVCISAASCTAVGWAQVAGVAQTLTENWNGSSWAFQATPNPAGALQSHQYGISCSSATACTAVGYWTASGGVQAPLVLRWNGSTWALQTAPSPAGSTVAQLHAVACTSATACTAVGSAVDAGGVTSALAETWNGTSWTIVAVPAPAGATAASLESISCPSSTSCVAVGGWSDARPAAHDLALGWNGTSWSILPATTGAGFAAVSCATTTACKAVGADAVTAQAWDGASWTAERLVTFGFAASGMFDVSCPTVAFCAGQGQTVHQGQARTMSQLWF